MTYHDLSLTSHLSLSPRIHRSLSLGDSLCLHEATVGAGLPIITTVKDLMDTGDEIIRMEGVLSGTRLSVA